MIRKQIYIEPEQERYLKELAREREKSEAEVIRDAINHEIQLNLDLYSERVERFFKNSLKAKDRFLSWEEEMEFIQSLIDKGPIKGKRKWNRESLYEDRLIRKKSGD